MVFWSVILPEPEKDYEVNKGIRQMIDFRYFNLASTI